MHLGFVTSFYPPGSLVYLLWLGGSALRRGFVATVLLVVAVLLLGFQFYRGALVWDEGVDEEQHFEDAGPQPEEAEGDEGEEEPGAEQEPGTEHQEEDETPAGEPEEEEGQPEPSQTAPYIEGFEFTALPTLGEYIGSITPLGWLGASTRERPDIPHPLSNERHHIFFNDGFTEGIPIFAPGSGLIEWASVSPLGEWGFTVVVNETLSFYLDHIGYLNATLLGQLMELDFYVPNQIYVNRGIRVYAGQVVGYTNTTDFFDWGVVDEGVVDGIANRSHYTWRRHMHGVSAYGYASEELKEQLEEFYGLWNPGRGGLYRQVGEPIGGRVRNDVNGTLQGIWFYDHEVDEAWGQKIALFTPYSMNRHNYQIRLSIPEVSIYGNWMNVTLEESGDLNLKPHLVTVDKGIVGYVLNGDRDSGEEGLLLVQLIDDFHLRFETFKGVFSMPEFPEFTENSVILYR
jgi:hypothetical protein